MAVVLVAAVVVLSLLVIGAGVLTGSVTVVVVALVGPLLVVAAFALVAWMCRDRLRSWATRSIIGLAGPAIVRSMPPREVLTALLDRVFGETVRHEEISTALLGGGGHDAAGFDIAV